MMVMRRRGGELDHWRRANGMRFRVGRSTTGTTTTNPAQGRTYRRGCALILLWGSRRVCVDPSHAFQVVHMSQIEGQFRRSSKGVYVGSSIEEMG